MGSQYYEELIGLRVGFAMTGSFCTIREVLLTLEDLTESGANVFPILSESTGQWDTRFIGEEELKCRLTAITGNAPICTVQDAEPIGPKGLLDVVAVVPCTGNTLAKLAHSITDSPVLMAVKSHLRNNRPVVLGISTNDGLMGSAMNLGKLMATKNYYFVPFGQDDPVKKPFSLVADFKKLNETIKEAAYGRQLQPILLRE